MDESSLILSIDQGTTSSRVFVFNVQGQVVGSLQESHQFYTPEKHWVEHDPNEIWEHVSKMVEHSLDRFDQSRIKAIGITNQRETVVFWDKHTGRALRRAIVWQDSRTDAFCDQLRNPTIESDIREKTGLTLNPYFSASKINWALTHDDAVRQALKDDRLLVGTMDTFIMYQLSNGAIFKTDVTNASRTLLFNIQTGHWDQSLLDLFSIPESILPEVVASDAYFGDSSYGIPITGVAGDQQSALIGQQCFTAGAAKMTFGTGGFFLLNIGEEYQNPPEGLLTTIAYELMGERRYAVEGSVFHAASMINWLKRIGLIHHPAECDALFNQADPSDETLLVPAFTGLGAPYWRTDLNASWHGLTLATGRAELVRSAVSAIALQSVDLFSALGPQPMQTLRVDGGVSQSDCLCQLLADLTGLTVQRPQQLETTVLGAMIVAAIGCGIFSKFSDLDVISGDQQPFEPNASASSSELLSRWRSVIASLL